LNAPHIVAASLHAREKASVLSLHRDVLGLRQLLGELAAAYIRAALSEDRRLVV